MPAGTAGGLRPDLAGSKVPHEKENAKQNVTPRPLRRWGWFRYGDEGERSRITPVDPPPPCARKAGGFSGISFSFLLCGGRVFWYNGGVIQKYLPQRGLLHGEGDMAHVVPSRRHGHFWAVYCHLPRQERFERGPLPQVQGPAAEVTFYNRTENAYGKNETAR